MVRDGRVFVSAGAWALGRCCSYPFGGVAICFQRNIGSTPDLWSQRQFGRRILQCTSRVKVFSLFCLSVSSLAGWLARSSEAEVLASLAISSSAFSVLSWQAGYSLNSDCISVRESFRKLS